MASSARAKKEDPLLLRAQVAIKPLNARDLGGAICFVRHGIGCDAARTSLIKQSKKSARARTLACAKKPTLWTQA